MTATEYLVIGSGLLFGLAATAWLTAKYDLRRPNFRKDRIPAVAGLIFVLCAEWIYGYEWLSDRLDPAPAAAYFLVTLGFGILGLLDDLQGDRSVGGFRGHFAALRQGRMTTGAVKALGGGVVSLAAGAMVVTAGQGGWRALPAAALIALTANALNLLDLRPGRCLFGFLVGAAVVIVTLVTNRIADIGFLFYIAAGLAVILYPLDSRGLVMLGDTGANAFGAVLGLAGAIYFSVFWQVVLIVGLLAFHIWSERHSLTRTIDANPLLRGIDRIIGVR